MQWERSEMPEIVDERVWKALNTIPRERFVDKSMEDYAYDNIPLPIGYGQTISQPFIVAFMTQLLRLKGNEKVLEIGTGSGYQTAFLALLAKEVYTVEIIKPLQEKAKKVLSSLKYDNIKFKIGSGFDGWIEYAPYDAIVVTCAPENIPPSLVQQLDEGGRMVIPVGPAGGEQYLYLITREKDDFIKEKICPVRFVPMLKRADCPEEKARKE